MRRSSAKRAPIALTLPVILAGSVMTVPFIYLISRAISTEPKELASLVLRPMTLTYLLNTVSLVGCVLVLTTAISLPLAFIITCSNLRYKKFLTILAVLPLAIPGYIMAYALIGLSGYYGPLNVFFNLRLPRLEGLIGASLALSLYTFPYLFLTLRSAFLGIDQALIETARFLGRSRVQTFWYVVIPHTRPVLLSGWTIIALYTIGEYGTVSLMRYTSFSSAIYNQHANAFEVHYAACLALILMCLAGLFILCESTFSRTVSLAHC